MTITHTAGPEAYIQAWLILSVVTYGVLALIAPGWRRRTRLVLAALSPVAIMLIIAWSMLRLLGGRRD